jgi:hypothetical protein
MSFIHWLAANGMELLQAVGIVAGLGFTTAAFLKDDASRRISNLLTIIKSHRDIWSEVYNRPELSRVLKRTADLQRHPVTDEEARFVTFLLHHLGTSYRALREGMFSTRQALDRDIRWFLNLPIPRQVWEESREFLEADFVDFVERHRVYKTKNPTTNGWV